MEEGLRKSRHNNAVASSLMAFQVLISSGLIAFALMNAGQADKKLQAKKQEAQYKANEQKLAKVFNPAMAKVGQIAVEFTAQHKDSAIWYENYDGQWSLTMSDDNEGHTLDLDLKPKADKSNITSGDVTSIQIKNTKPIINIFGQKYDFVSELRIDPEGNPGAECGKGMEASANYEYLDMSGESSSPSFATADRCDGQSINIEQLSDATSSTRAGQFIVSEMEKELQTTLQAIK